MSANKSNEKIYCVNNTKNFLNGSLSLAVQNRTVTLKKRHKNELELQNSLQPKVKSHTFFTTF